MADYIVAGLGNPGSKYENTRHNIGFMVLDLLADRLNTTFSVECSPEREMATCRTGGNRVFLLKPLTYMNRSGEAVSCVQRFYKIPAQNVLVVHDDLDMRLGRIKLVRSGGAGGHNGIRSIIACMGTREFPRLKLGIGRPDGDMPVDRYVLSRFRSEEQECLERFIDTAADAAECWLENGIQDAMNSFNRMNICG